MIDFDAFWSAYPSRRPHPHPKQPAKAAWERATRAGADPAVILAGAEAYASYAALEAVEARFICHAATWLNQRRWEQYAEPEPVKPEVSEETRAKMRAMSVAAMIKTGQHLPSVTDQYVNQLVNKGYLTASEAERVGYALPRLRVVG